MTIFFTAMVTCLCMGGIARPKVHQLAQSSSTRPRPLDWDWNWLLSLTRVEQGPSGSDRFYWFARTREPTGWVHSPYLKTVLARLEIATVESAVYLSQGHLLVCISHKWSLFLLFFNFFYGETRYFLWKEIQPPPSKFKILEMADFYENFLDPIIAKSQPSFWPLGPTWPQGRRGL